MSEQKEKEFSIKDYFVPLTTIKVIHFLFIIGFCVYFLSFFNGFVWDDFPYLVNNQDIRSLNIAQLFNKNIFNDASFYRPLPALYNTLLYRISGDTPFIYHFIQLVLHCVNACLVFFLLKKFFKKAISFFLALVFLVHPINVEAVAYISAANNQLFFLFGMLALLISMKREISRMHLVLIALFSLMSVLSRETGFAFLVLIVVFQLLYHKKRIYKLLVFEIFSLCVYFLLRFFYAGIYYTKEITRYPIPIAQLSFIERLQNIPLILFYYLSHIFYPMHFAVSQHWIVTNKTLDNFYLPLCIDSIVMTFLIWLAFYLYKSRKLFFKAYVFFIIWLFSGIVFILQIMPLELTVADHWMYFPLIGILGILGVCIESMQVKIVNKKISKYLVVLAIIIVILLSIRSVLRVANYKDEITLYTHDSAIYSDWKLENDLGSDYARIGDMKNAYIHFQRSYEDYPTPWNMYHLGMYYQDLGDNTKALRYDSQAYESIHSNEFKSLIKSGESNLEYNLYLRLANVYLLTKEYSSSIMYAKRGIQYYPGASDLWVTLAASHYFMGNQSDALNAAIKAKELSPNNKNIYLYNQIKNKKELKI